MTITLFSFIMAILWSVLLTVAVYILRRKQWFVRNYGVGFLLLIYAGIIIRTIFSVEFNFAQVVSSSIYNNVYSAITAERIIDGFKITPLFILFVSWIVVTLILLIRFFVEYRSGINKIKNMEKYREKRCETELIKIIDSKFVREIKVYKSTEIVVPMAVGLIHKQILLPNTEYGEANLKLILLHEYTHLRNHDMWVRLLVELLCCFFWWNPFVYLMKKDLHKVLEIKCDLTVTREMKNKDKAIYLSTIRDALFEGTSWQNYKSGKQVVAAEIVNNKNHDFTKERFQIVLGYKRKRKQEIFFNIIMIIIMATTLLASYSFIFQPKYEAPMEDIITSENTYETTLENTYILKHKDGTYSIVDEHGVTPIREETVEILLGEKVELIEEE